MAGRYDPMSKATAFNDGDDRYEGMLVVRSELTSMCPSSTIVKGVAYIGILAQKH